jgi:hypothetical protein
VVRAVLLGLLFCLFIAAPASAHDGLADHTDSRGELAFADVGRTVETVDRAAGTSGEGLPLSWCGDERSDDDVAHAAFGPEQPQFKLVYADAPSRFAAWKDALQADVSLLGRFIGAQSGGRRTPRFDMGTACGPQYVDLQVVALPNTRGYYANDLGRIRADVLAQVPDVPGRPRNVVVLADRMSSSPAGYWSGIGQGYATEVKGDANRHNAGNLMAVLWVPDAEPAPGADPDGWWPEGMLHEMTHNLGAVGASAPHATTAGHCSDGHDVMCYRDAPSTVMTYPCAEISGVMTQVYDCGGDDYFNVAPAAGTYLATHFNVYDNRFLAACEDVAPACGGTTDPGTIPQPPVSTAMPQVTGEARVGAVLAGTTGGWANAPTGYAYQWEQGADTMWEAVPGATGPSYRPTEADQGLRLRLRVIAANGDGSTAAYSAPSGWVTGSATGAPAGSTRGRVALRLAPRKRGHGRGRRIATVPFRLAGGRLKTSATRVRLPRSRYRLALCAPAGGACARGTVTVRRHPRTRLPALSLDLPARDAGRISYTARVLPR